MLTVVFMVSVIDGEHMRLLLNVGGPDRVSRVQMAEAVANFRGYDTSLIKPVPASSVCSLSHTSAELFPPPPPPPPTPDHPPK